MNTHQSTITRMILLIAVGCLPWSAFADDDHFASQAGDEQEIQMWIDMLGDPSFTVRQNANRRLVEAGITALPQLRRAAEHPDRELGYRVQRLIDFMDRVTLRQQVDAFLEADDPEKFGMPCWSEYIKLMKDEAAARLLFADMLRQEMNLLKKMDANAATDYDDVLEERLLEVQETSNFDTNAVEIGTVCALCFCVYQRDIKLDVNHQNLLLNATGLAQVKSAVNGGERKDAIQRLITLAVIDNDNFSDMVALQCGTNLQMASVIPRAKRVSDDKTHSVPLRQGALLIIGQLGTQEDVEFLEQLFDDQTVSTLFRDKDPRTTIGDIAVFAAIKLSRRYSEESGVDPEKIFTDEQQRLEIRESFAKFRAEQKAKPATKEPSAKKVPANNEGIVN